MANDRIYKVIKWLTNNDSTVEESISAELMSSIRVAINELPERQRAVGQLYADGYTIDEISTLLDMSKKQILVAITLFETYVTNALKKSAGDNGRQGVSQDAAGVSSLQSGQTKPIINILVVDDYFFDRELLQVELTKPDRQIDVARTGTAALKMLLENEYALLITDIYHDGINGLDLIKEIKSRALPLSIIVSSYNRSLNSIVAALQAGADDYILKPYNVKRLEAVIDRILSREDAGSQVPPRKERQSPTDASEQQFDAETTSLGKARLGKGEVEIAGKQSDEIVKTELANHISAVIDELPELGLVRERRRYVNPAERIVPQLATVIEGFRGQERRVSETIGDPAERLAQRIEALVRSLDSDDETVRLQAVRTLEIFGEEGIPGLTKALFDKATVVRKETVLVLMSMVPADSRLAIPALIKVVLEDADSEIRSDAIIVLSLLHDNAMSAIPALLKVVLEDTDSAVCSTAVHALRELTNNFTQVIPDFMNVLVNSKDSDVRKTFMRELVSLSDDPPEMVMDACLRIVQSDKDGAFRRELGDLFERSKTEDYRLNVRQLIEARKRSMIHNHASYIHYGHEETYDDNACKLETQEQFMRPSVELPDSPVSTQEGKTRAEYLDALLPTVSKDAPYEDQAKAYAAVREDFIRAYASKYLEILKTEIGRRAHTTHDDKKDLVGWINGELRRFGLAIRSPKNSLPATLVTGPGNKPEEGRFIVRNGDPDSGNQETFITSKLPKLLEKLALMDAPPREEPLAKVHATSVSPRKGHIRE